MLKEMRPVVQIEFSDERLANNIMKNKPLVFIHEWVEVDTYKLKHISLAEMLHFVVFQGKEKPH